MIQELLSPRDCAECRGCCIFAAHELWEAPETALPLKPHGEYFACRHLSESGCSLGESKPADCAMYPFRVMTFEERKVIALSRFCKAVNALPLSQLTAFADANTQAFLDCEDCGALVKDYNHEYVILKVLENLEEHSCTSE